MSMPNSHDRPTERQFESRLDDLYDRFSRSDPFMPITGFIDHTTMAAEALIELGQGHRLATWSSRARVRPLRAAPAGTAIETDWQQALGQRRNLADWIGYFDRELGERPARTVLSTWVPRFAHDPGAFLFHGLIRTGHATRALRHRDTPQRRAELARGLALWAIGVKGPSRETPKERASKGALDFARLAARAFAQHSDIRTLHLVTGPMAAQLLEDDAGESAPAIFADGFARTHNHLLEAQRLNKVSKLDADAARVDEATLERLSDVHAIKLTEAAIRGYRLSGDPAFIAAARSV